MVRTASSRFALSRAEGARVIARLDRWWSPRWLDFTDLHGSLVRIRTSEIVEIFDTGPDSRRSEFMLGLCLAAEDEAYSPSDDDDDC